MSAQPKRDTFWFYPTVFIGRSIRLLAQWEQLRLSSSGKYDEWQVTSSLGVFAKCLQIMSCRTCQVIIGAGAELKINWAMEGISFWVRLRCHAFYWNQFWKKIVCCQLQTPCFSENENIKKLIQNTRKCCLRHATNVRFSDFRGWRRISKSRYARFLNAPNPKKCPIIPRFLPESLERERGAHSYWHRHWEPFRRHITCHGGTCKLFWPSMPDSFDQVSAISLLSTNT